MTDDQVLVKLQVLSLEQRLAKLQVAYFGRMVCKAPRVLWRMVLLSGPAPRSWLSLLLRLLRAAWLKDEGLQAAMPDPALRLHSWCEAVKSQGKAFLGKVSRAVLGSCENAFSPVVICAEHVLQVYRFPCPSCEKVFDSEAALRTHQWHRHDRWSSLRSRVCTTFCVCCLVDFHSVDRLMKHLRRNPGKTSVNSTTWIMFLCLNSQSCRRSSLLRRTAGMRAARSCCRCRQ